MDPAPLPVPAGAPVTTLAPQDAVPDVLAAPLPLPTLALTPDLLAAYLTQLAPSAPAGPALRLALWADGQIVIHYEVAGVGYQKPISLAALRHACLQLPTDSGWLPPRLVRTGETAAGPFAVLWIPPAVHPLVLAGDPTPARVPLPGLVLCGLGAIYRVWATAGPTFAPDALLAHAPLPNVYADGRICWGANQPPLAAPAALPTAARLFLAETPFTNAAANDKSRAAPRAIRPQLRALAAAGAAAYPLDDLLPVLAGPPPGRQVTVAAAVAMFLQSPGGSR